MQYKNLIFFAFVSVFALGSCQKDYSIDSGSGSGNNNGGNALARPKTYTEELTEPNGHESITFNLNYDGSNRLVSLVAAADPSTKMVYTYNSSGLAKLDIYNTGSLSLHEEFYLNRSNRPDSTFQYNDTGDSTTEKYLYNGNKQLVLVKNYQYSKLTGGELDFATSYQYDAAGNLVKETDGITTTTYEYTTQTNPLINLSPFTLDILRLVKTTTIDDGMDKIIFNHTYTFDSSNRLTSEKMTSTDNSIIVVRSYTY